MNRAVADEGWMIECRRIVYCVAADLCGTPGYLAPELLRANMYEKAPGYGRPVDM